MMMMMNTALPEMLHCFNGGFYFDQGIGDVVVGGAIKPDPGVDHDDLGRIVLNCSNPDTGPAPAENSKKRKPEKPQSIQQEKPEDKKMKVLAEEECKSTTTTTGSSNSNTNNKNAKPETAAPKTDYIHVRARRGQATDSHSLAERVRREKISERMKYLQDLVPGCNKITGKAGMLDEIINYVQSLQRQVEFLSMKLAAINPMVDFDIDGYVTKEIFPTSYHVMSMLDTFLESSTSCSLNMTTWEEELQMCMGYQQQQGRPTPFTPQTFAGLLEAGHVKLEM